MFVSNNREQKHNTNETSLHLNRVNPLQSSYHINRIALCNHHHDKYSRGSLIPLQTIPLNKLTTSRLHHYVLPENRDQKHNTNETSSHLNRVIALQSLTTLSH